jgi:hypothetical protein
MISEPMSGIIILRVIYGAILTEYLRVIAAIQRVYCQITGGSLQRL